MPRLQVHPSFLSGILSHYSSTTLQHSVSSCCSPEISFFSRSWPHITLVKTLNLYSWTKVKLISSVFQQIRQVVTHQCPSLASSSDQSATKAKITSAVVPLCIYSAWSLSLLSAVCCSPYLSFLDWVLLIRTVFVRYTSCRPVLVDRTFRLSHRTLLHLPEPLV